MVGLSDLFQSKGLCDSIKSTVDIVSSCAVRSGLCHRKDGISPLELGLCLEGDAGTGIVKSSQEFLTGLSISLPHQGLDGPSSMRMEAHGKGKRNPPKFSCLQLLFQSFSWVSKSSLTSGSLLAAAPRYSPTFLPKKTPRAAEQFQALFTDRSRVIIPQG